MTRRHDLELERDELLRRALEAERDLGIALERNVTLDTAVTAERARSDAWEATSHALEHRIEELIASSDAGWGAFVKRRVIVNTTAGEAFAGILWDGEGPLILRDASLLGEHGAPLPSPAKLDGEAIIDFARVAWVQVPAAAEV